MAESPERILPCPNCKKPTRWSSKNAYRPFCSERCRLIDFGAWATEKHTIPGEQFDDVSTDDVTRPPDD